MGISVSFFLFIAVKSLTIAMFTYFTIAMDELKGGDMCLREPFKGDRIGVYIEHCILVLFLR